MSDRKYIAAIDKASKQADKGARKELCFSDDHVVIRIDSRGVLTIAVFEDRQLFNRLLKFCDDAYSVTRSTPPSEWFGTIYC